MKKLFVAIALCAAAPLALAQDAFPSRLVRILVPQTPGSTVDVFARLISERLSAKWGQPVTVDNRTGAGGAISMEAVAKSSPDGYTLSLTTEGAITIIPHLQREPRYRIADFAPVTRIASAPYVLVANPALEAGSVKELIALAKSRPGQINFASGGPGTGTHLSGELLKSMAHISIVHVPYKGASLGLTDVMSGQTQMMFIGAPAALAQVRAGRLKALAVTTQKRSAVLPDVPSVSESLPGFEVAPWWGVLAPAATPRPVVEKLYADISETLRGEALKQQFNKQGAEPIGDTPEQFAVTLKKEYENWGTVVKEAGIRVE